MTNRSSALGALAWMILAAMLASAALEPCKARTQTAGCFKSATEATAKCATIA